MKKVMKVIGIVLFCIVVLIVSFLMVKNYINSKRPWLADDYYTEVQSNAPLEKKYAGLDNYDVSHTVIKAEDDTIKKFRIWYPTELEKPVEKFPLILVTNASNMATLNYEPFFERLSSWGFVVIGNDDRQTGTGVSASQTLNYMLKQNDNSDSIFCGKIDVENIGIVGYSQGGAGAIRAITEYENSSKYKTIFTGSAAYANLAQMWGGYETTKVSVPWFMTAGTGSSDDSGKYSENEFARVAPLFSLEDNYDAMSNDVFKLRARVVGAEHEDMQTRTGGYMTAWMLYQLQDDEEAEKVFVGNNAEILNNSNWQDVEKNDVQQ